MPIDFDQHIRDFVEGDVIFEFCKELFIENIADDLLSIESTINSLELDLKIRKRVFYVSVEMIQNLYHHKMTDKGDVAEPLVRLAWYFVSKTKNGFSIVTGNFLKNEDAVKVKEHIEKINSHKPEDLKSLYTNILTNQKFSEKGGGGLGMVDVARKAGGKYTFEFLPYHNNLTFLELQIPINNNSL